MLIEEIVENDEKPGTYRESMLSKSRLVGSETPLLEWRSVKITLVIQAFARVDPESIKVFYHQNS